jgi:hypothetical protein
VASPLSPHATPPVPDAESGASSFGRCGNCGTPLSGPFCSRCGEKKLTREDYSLSHLLEETLDVLTHFDSRFLRTLKVLFTKPGELSNAYFRGGRSRYTKPLTVFVIINIVFFVIQPHTFLLQDRYNNYIKIPSYSARVRNHLLATKEPEQTYAARFNTNLQNQKKSLLIVSVPLLAIVMVPVFFGTRRTYAEHLVFSIQVYTFVLIFLAATVAVFFPLVRLLRAIGPAGVSVLKVIGSDSGITGMLLAGLTIYIYLALRRAYETSRLRSALSALILAWAVAILIGVYHEAAFFATFWTT